MVMGCVGALVLHKITIWTAWVRTSCSLGKGSSDTAGGGSTKGEAHLSVREVEWGYGVRVEGGGAVLQLQEVGSRGPCKEAKSLCARAPPLDFRTKARNGTFGCLHLLRIQISAINPNNSQRAQKKKMPSIEMDLSAGLQPVQEKCLSWKAVLLSWKVALERGHIHPPFAHSLQPRRPE